MTIVYSQNFSSTSIGSLPSGWTAIAGTWAVTTTDPVTGDTNALCSTSAADGDKIVCTDGGPLADMEVRYDVNYQDYFAGIYLRADSALQNAYVLIPGETAVSSFNVYKIVGGSATQIGTITIPYLQGVGPGALYSLRARVQGSIIYLKVWVFGEAEPGSWDGTVTDTSITAAGYYGFYNGNGSTAARIDNVTLDNLVSSSLSVSPGSVTTSSGGNTLALTGVGTSWMAGTPGSPAFTASAGTITAQTVASATSATLTYTAPSSAGSVTIIDPSTSDTATLTINANAATDFSIAPSSQNATVGDASPSYTVQPNGPPSSSLTIALTDASAGGTFKNSAGATITLLTFTTSAAQTVTYTPASTGTKTLTGTPSGAGLTTPHSVVCVASTGPITIPVTSSGIYWSPANWDHLTPGTFGVSVDTMQTTAPGAELETVVTGTANLTVTFDDATTSGLSSGEGPILRYSLNNAPWVDVQLAPTQTSLVISTSLTTSGSYDFLCILKGLSNTSGDGDVWGSSGVRPTNALSITGLMIDGGGSVSAPTLPFVSSLAIASDSIGAGEHANYDSDGTDDATASFTYHLARSLGYNLSNLSYGGQGLTVTGGSSMPDLLTTYSHYSAGRARNWAGVGALAIIQGGNDYRQSQVSGSTIQSAIATILPEYRAALGAGKPIFVFVECQGYYATNLQAAVEAYVSSSGDTNCYFVNPISRLPPNVFKLTFGSGDRYTYDNVHPIMFGHFVIGTSYAAEAAVVLGGGTTIAGYSRSRVANA